MKKLIFPFLLGICYLTLSTAQSTLSLDQIMQGEQFVGYLPQDIHWSTNSRNVYFSWNPEMDTLRHLYQTDLSGSTPQKVATNTLQTLPKNGSFNKDCTWYLYEKYGDIFLQEVATQEIRMLTNTVAREQNPVFAADEQSVLYTLDNNLFALGLDGLQIRQLTDFRKGKKPTDQALLPQEAWLEADQLEYFEVLGERHAEEATRQRRAELLEVDRPNTYYFGDRTINHLKASPDLRFISLRLTKSAKAKRTMVPDFVTQSGYLDPLSARPKVGSPVSSYLLGIYDTQRDTLYYVDTDSLPGIYEKPAYYSDYHQGPQAYNPTFEEPRSVLVHDPIYSDLGQAVVEVRALDNKDRWIAQLDLETGALTTIDRQHDEAWIAGPGIGWVSQQPGAIGWLDEARIWFQSEKTGFSHLYSKPIKGGQTKALTNGDFEILTVQLSNDKSTFYITANAEGPQAQHFYHLPVEGGQLKRLTNTEGKHEITLSPDEQHLAIRYSYSNKPWELYLMENKEGASPKRVTQSTTKAFRSYSWQDPEIIRFQARDGAMVPARIYRPVNPKKKGPAVIFVHGAGYLQNVHKWWSNYYREYMFHNLLVDQGYTVLDIDYRASRGYGRDWRTGIYRHMGGKDLNDQIDGVQYLVDEYGIDPDRIGIYGGSYGGFITLMALFTSPGTFKCGAALRSVTDWAHYNHTYTSNILNTPVLDSMAFRRSSPIYHAEGLQDHLLILHGMVDRNVQFQDVVRLAQRLIELKKENWEFAVFPMEGHGFVEPSSWTDEYRRIFELFEEHLKP